ncbi:hypothetical protein B296_00010321 [Ensete ventricosum]|uniref:Uncharacterized protein n=1 Tax=Ensete ventricosum TaxID=4639 RepID=A0A426YNB3_ENSVE|nr:hypothetical protein B296_00010321 [Ensete ventricosum]
MGDYVGAASAAKGGRSVVNRGEGLTAIDFGSHVSLAEKEGAGMTGKGGLIAIAEEAEVALFLLHYERRRWRRQKKRSEVVVRQRRATTDGGEVAGVGVGECTVNTNRWKTLVAASGEWTMEIRCGKGKRKTTAFTAVWATGADESDDSSEMWRSNAGVATDGYC